MAVGEINGICTESSLSADFIWNYFWLKMLKGNSKVNKIPMKMQ